MNALRMSRSERRDREGFALVAALWIVAMVAVVGAGASLIAREGMASGRNRVALREAAWKAEGCTEIARAVIGEALMPSAGLRAGWGTLDDAIAESPMLAGCSVEITPAGVALDVNSASQQELRRLLATSVERAEAIDSLVEALLDWADADDDVRAFGAERDWYESHRRSAPRNGPYAAVAELRLVRGFESLQGIDSLIGVEPGRVTLSHAPVSVIAALPGLEVEAAERIVDRRVRGEPVTDLAAFSGELSPAARDSLHARYATLVSRVALEPDAWIVTAHATNGMPPVTASVELRLVRAGTRAAVVRRRGWP